MEKEIIEKKEEKKQGDLNGKTSIYIYNEDHRHRYGLIRPFIE